MGDHQVVPCRLREEWLTGICCPRCVEQTYRLDFPGSGLSFISNHVIRQATFPFQGPLGGDAGLSRFRIQPVPRDQAFELLGFIAVHQPDFAAERLQSRFEQQRNHQNNGWCLGMEPECLVEALPHDWVNQLLEPPPFRGVLEHDPTQGSSVDCRVLLGLDRGSVPLQHGVSGRATGREGFSGELIRIQHRQPLLRHPTAHAAFAAGNPAREPDASLRERLARRHGVGAGCTQCLAADQRWRWLLLGNRSRVV